MKIEFTDKINRSYSLNVKDIYYDAETDSLQISDKDGSEYVVHKFNSGIITIIMEKNNI